MDPHNPTIVSPVAGNPSHVGILLLPGFSLMAYAATVEPLRSANLMRGQELYRWTHLSPEGGAVESSGRLPVATTALPDLEALPDLVMLCGGLGAETYRHRLLPPFLRRMRGKGRLIGAVSTASFILARAGLLRGHRCTVHWDYRSAFVEAFPDLEVCSELFVVDRGIGTCAGGVAAMDMMLHLIRERHGSALSALIADQFIHGTLRQPRERQRMALQHRLDTSSPQVAHAVALMEAHIEAPLSVAAIAARVKLSGRQLERLFRGAFDVAPARYYLNLRLDEARKLLRLSTLSITDIAVATGFVSTSHFAKSYRLYTGHAPRHERRKLGQAVGR
jgi:transcriptional regulator GlxA family with amidase domain